MVAQNGKDLLIKIDMTGDGQFETLAGLRATVAAARAGRDGGWEAAWARTVAPLFGGVKG